MSFATLRTFTDVMRLGSFAAAARFRDQDPSSISRCIAALETELGYRLFDRSTRRFMPTEAGRIYFRQIEPLLDQFDEAAERARDSVDRPAGNLKVTASVAFGYEVLVPLLRQFRELYPDISVEFVLSDQVVDIVGEKIDAAIRLGPPPSGDLVRTRLTTVRHRVCASPGYIAEHGLPDAPGSLSQRRCVRFPYSGYKSCWHFRDSSGHIVAVPVDGEIVISNALALKRCVLEGLGPGLLADWMIAQEIKDGSLIDLFPRQEATAAEFDTSAWLVYPSRAYLPGKLRVFIDFLREKLEECPAQ